MSGHLCALDSYFLLFPIFPRQLSCPLTLGLLARIDSAAMLVRLEPCCDRPDRRSPSMQMILVARCSSGRNGVSWLVKGLNFTRQLNQSRPLSYDCLMILHHRI